MGEAPSTAVGCQRGHPISPNSVRRGRSTLILGALALAALLLFVWSALRRPPEVASAPAEPPRAAEEAKPPARESPASELADTKAAPRSAPNTEETPERAATAPHAPPAAAAAPRKPDLAARAWILFRVKDEHGAPVAGAEVQLAGMRRKTERGSVYGWRGEPDHGTTAVDGTVKLPFPVWVTLDDETASVVVYVHHPDFVTYENQDCPLAETVDVVLQRGSVLVIAGWLGTKEHVVTDVKPRFSWDVDLKPDDWLPRRDGRMTTTRMKPGHHVVMLVWQSPDHGVCFSDLTLFETVAGEDQELFLELHPAKTLHGRLGPEVPRPVVDGEVSVGVQMASGGESRGSILDVHDAIVQSDGTFEVPGVPAGPAQIVGICKGFATKMLMLGNVSISERIAPEIDIRTLDDVYVLNMEPTAVLELELRGPDGKPAAGVLVNAWPNACWRVGACGTYAEHHSWSATSDADGRARIEDIPAGEHGFGIAHAELDLQPEGPNGDRYRRTQFSSGETVRLAFDLVKKAGG